VCINSTDSASTNGTRKEKKKDHKTKGNGKENGGTGNSGSYP